MKITKEVLYEALSMACDDLQDEVKDGSDGHCEGCEVDADSCPSEPAERDNTRCWLLLCDAYIESAKIAIAHKKETLK